MVSLAFKTARLAAAILLFVCLPRPATAGLVLSFDSVALYGAPGDLITITTTNACSSHFGTWALRCESRRW